MVEIALPEGFHENSRIMEVPLAELQIDRSYQRDPSQALVDRIADNWDEVASELVLVSDRGERTEESSVQGGLFLVNGQHRSLGARKRGMEKIWARVVDTSNLEDPAAVEAALRLKTNVRLGDRPLERFKAQLRAGDESSQEIVRILANFDTEINEVPNGETGINAVSTVETIHNADLLYDTISLLKDAYETLGGRNVSSGMMRAAAWFIEKHAFETDRYRVVEKMKMTGTGYLHTRALSFKNTHGGSLWMNYYRSLVDMYNEKLADKNKIEWRLRGSSALGRDKAAVKWS